MKLFELDVSGSGEDAIRWANEVEKKQIPFAQSLALNRTAQKVKSAEINEMKRVFHNPTRFTLNALMIRPSTKRNLVATVWLKDKAFKGGDPDKYLRPQIVGGSRPAKRFESHLRRRGLLPNNKYVVPGKGVRLTKAGNISKGQITQALSALQAQFDPIQNSKDKRKKTYFAGVVNGTHGVWQRMARGVKPIMIFIDNPRYRNRFRFYEVANRTAIKHYDPEFKKALAFALATAEK